MNSRDITRYAQAIIDKFAEHNAEGTAVFARAVQIANEIGVITDDRLKRQAVLDEMLGKTSNIIIYPARCVNVLK
jgi:hypothetical protein